MAHFEVSRGQHFEAAPRLPTITKLKEPIVWIEVVPKKKVLPQVVWWKNRVYQAGIVALLVVGLLLAFSRMSHAQGFANVPGGFQILPPLATVTQPGLVQPDGTTVTITSAGVISAAGGSGTGCTVPNSTGIVTNAAGTCGTDTNAVLSAGTLSLGASGTLGDFVLGNATSGTITLEPVTGALGSVTLKLPAASDTLIGKATTDTLTNKTFDTAGTGNVFDINGTGITAVTGSGSVVLATSPTLVTPTLGAATATSINGNTFTSGTYTLTGTAGKTLTFDNSLEFAGADSTKMTFPSTSATIARTDAANTFTGTQTFGAVVGTTWNGNTWATGTGTLSIAAGKTFTASNSLTLAGTDSTTMTFPSSSDTVVTLAATQALTNKTYNGISVTASTGTLVPGTGTATFPSGNSGTVAELNLQQAWTAPQSTNTETPTISTATFTPVFSTGQNHRIVLVHANCPCTLANPAAIVAGQSGVFEIVQSATGSDTIGTWGSEYEYAGGTSAITLSTGASAADYIPYYVDSTGSYIVLGGIIKGPAH